MVLAPRPRHRPGTRRPPPGQSSRKSRTAGLPPAGTRAAYKDPKPTPTADSRFLQQMSASPVVPSGAHFAASIRSAAFMPKSSSDAINQVTRAARPTPAWPRALHPHAWTSSALLLSPSCSSFFFFYQQQFQQELAALPAIPAWNRAQQSHHRCPASGNAERQPGAAQKIQQSPKLQAMMRDDLQSARARPADLFPTHSFAPTYRRGMEIHQRPLPNVRG